MSKVADLSVEDFKKLVHESVEESIEDYLDDIKALMSPEYVESIKRAREDFKEGRAKTLEKAFGV
jgi:hypothetical protein